MIRMKKDRTAAGPMGTFVGGQQYSASAEFERALVEAGVADYVGTPPKPVLETAEAPAPEENAALRTERTEPPKKTGRGRSKK